MKHSEFDQIQAEKNEKKDKIKQEIDSKLKKRNEPGTSKFDRNDKDQME